MNRETLNTLGARLAVELVILAVFYTVLRQQDAPPWAFTLLVLIGTRASKMELHNGLGYLQQTLQRKIGVVGPMNVTGGKSLDETLAEAMQPRDGDKVVIEPGQQPMPLKRHGVGRWGRG